MRPYSFLRHLGRSLTWRDGFRDSLSVAIFTAYFDASGDKRKTVLSVVGYVSSVSKWERFEKEWTRILKDEEVPAMHMTDFVSSQQGFASWKGQTDRRRNFISRLTDCIRLNTKAGFGCTLVTEDYRQVDREFMLNESVGHPFVLCARTCLGGLAKWARKKCTKREEILVLIENGDEDSGDLVKAAREDGYKIIPLSKKDAVHFQAADVAAWKFRTAVYNVLYEPLRNEDDAQKILRSTEPITATVQKNGAYDREALIGLCRDAGIPKRRARMTA
jgi:hypothetical protein